MKNINKFLKQLLFITLFVLAFLGNYYVECYATGITGLNINLDITSPISTPNLITNTNISNITPNFSSTLTTGIYQENNSSLTYSDGWVSVDSTNYDYGSIKVAKVPGSYVKFTFSGTSFELYGIKSPMSGMATINIDGNDIATVDCYNYYTLYNTLVFSTKTLSDTTHTVIITNSTNKNTKSSSTDFAIDRITINDTNTVLSTGVYEEYDKALVYSGTWRLSRSSNYSNSSIKISKVPGSTLKFTFSGNSFNIYGLKCKMYGTFIVNIDGTNVDIVDCYNPLTIYNTLIYSSGKLNDGIHNVTITSNTAINPSSTSTDFAIDKISINDTSKVLSPGTYEDDYKSLYYSGNWQSVKSDNYSNGSINVAKVPGSAIRFTFSGTSFELYGLKCKMYGKATINIDGTDVAIIDAYNPSTIYNTLLYKSDNFSSGIHNVTITTNTTINPDSTSTDFAIDKITIYDAKILTTGIYEDDNCYLDYSNNWTYVKSDNYSNGSINVAKVPGSTLTFTFSGTSFKLYGVKSSMNGVAIINIDGSDVATVDAYNKYTLYNSLLYSASNLNDGIHTVVITNSKNKNINSSSTDFSIDRIAINDTNTVLSTGIYEDNNNALVYSGTWDKVNSTNYSDGTLKVAKVPGSTLTFTFSGTSFELYGIKSPINGIATINIDGYDVATVDTYNKYTLYNSLLYSASNLDDGIHTVTITNNEVKNPLSSSTDLSIDKISINNTNTVLSTGIYDEDNSALNYSGNWNSINSDKYNNGSMKIAKVPGSTVRFTFSGTSFELFGLKCRMYGTATVNIDGTDVDTIDAYSSSTIYDSLLYKSDTLSNGIHNITITTNSFINPMSTSNDFSIDKIAIYTSDKVLTTGVYEDTCDSLDYSGNWTPICSTHYTDNYVKLAKDIGSSVSFTFSGTSFKLYGNRCSMYGMANVNIDGIDVATIDAYSPHSLYNELLFKSNILNDGIHCVTITIIDEKNINSTANDLAIDKVFINDPIPALESGLHEDTDSSLIYSGQWVPYFSKNYTNGSIMLSKAPNSSVQFTFKGTSIDIYGIKYSMYGIVKINIDGIDVNIIDTFSDPTEYSKLLHSSKNLSNGLHTVTITITEDKNDSATSTDFALDKIIIG